MNMELSDLSRRPQRLYSAYIFDLDGTVYLGDALLPTAGATIQRLRGLGKRTIFLSNNPTKTRAAQADALTRLGLPTPVEDVLNSGLVMARFLQRRMPGARLFVIGETPLQQLLRQAGFELADDAAVDAVIVSFDRTFDYHKLQVAFDALRGGARFFATNGDKYCPTPDGGQPDAAALIAALEACTDVKVEAIVGKPSAIMAEAALALLDLPPAECVMTGDRLETDVLMGLDAGMAAALTLTGATSAAQAAGSSIRATYVINRLAELLPESS
ncbi:MAG TPA: HAD-IIA family hydrolase [Anaerolineae bacterium]|nr:HAD-IIA family hydrolase [Anaerolineae bacterium]HNU05103.1 HAD-IIA family hydrolase [Anaerolineae bacterium]